MVKQLKRLIKEAIEDASEQQDYNFTINPQSLLVQFKHLNDFNLLQNYVVNLVFQKYINDRNLSFDKNIMSKFISFTYSNTSAAVWPYVHPMYYEVFQQCVLDIANNKVLNNQSIVQFKSDSICKFAFDLFVTRLQEFAINEQQFKIVTSSVISKYKNEIELFLDKMNSIIPKLFNDFDNKLKVVEQRIKQEIEEEEIKKLNFTNYNILYNAFSNTRYILMNLLNIIIIKNKY